MISISKYSMNFYVGFKNTFEASAPSWANDIVVYCIDTKLRTSRITETFFVPSSFSISQWTTLNEQQTKTSIFTGKKILLSQHFFRLCNLISAFIQRNILNCSLLWCLFLIMFIFRSTMQHYIGTEEEWKGKTWKLNFWYDKEIHDETREF